MLIAYLFLIRVLQGVYELWRFSSANFVKRGVKKLLATLEGVEDEQSLLCGAFKGTFGPVGATYCLWRHENFDDALTLRSRWLSNKGTTFLKVLF